MARTILGRDAESIIVKKDRQKITPFEYGTPGVLQCNLIRTKEKTENYFIFKTKSIFYAS